MNNSNRESTSFIYKKILSQLNPLNDIICWGSAWFFIVSPLWNDLFTPVERSFHLRGTIVSPGWNGIIHTWKRINCISFRKNM